MRQLLSAIFLGLMFVMQSTWAQTAYQAGTSFTLPNRGTVIYATNSGAKEVITEKGTYTCDYVPKTAPPLSAQMCAVYATHVVNVAQNKIMTAAYPVKISFGSGQTWVTKQFPRGKHACDASTFGSDPAPGVSKSCKEVYSFITCKPSQFGGDGSKGLFDRDAAGNCLAAWYCPGQPLPVLLVATAAKCNVSAARNLLGQLLTSPSTTSLEEMLAQNGMLPNVFTDPTLKSIWTPYTSKILALRSTLPK